MSDDTPRPADIVDLKEADKILHLRINRTQSELKESMKHVSDRHEKAIDEIRKISEPVIAMSNQVEINTKALDKWEKRLWAIVLVIIGQLIAIFFGLFKGGAL